MNRKGIILAGGSGTRLHPITKAVCKQLLPIYDKPLIYYPLGTLLHAGIKDILIIVSSDYNKQLFKKVLSDIPNCNIEYAIQNSPRGLAEAFIIAEKFLDNSPSVLILGDNIFYGGPFHKDLIEIEHDKNVIFGYKVKNPRDYGVAVFDIYNHENALIDVVEKPKVPPSDWSIPGLYFFDSTAPYRAKKLKPSNRRELEITDLIKTYIRDKNINFYKLNSGTVWFDTGTPDHLLEASNFVKAIQTRANETVGIELNNEHQ